MLGYQNAANEMAYLHARISSEPETDSLHTLEVGEALVSQYSDVLHVDDGQRIELAGACLLDGNRIGHFSECSYVPNISF